MILKRITVFFAFCLLSMSAAFAQASLTAADLKSIEIDKISDAEIRDFHGRAVQSGLTEDQLYELAKSRGLDNAQAEKLKLRIASLNLAGQKQSSEIVKNADGIGDNNAIRTFDGTLSKPMMESRTYDRRIFGSELFTSSSTTFEPNIRIATPVGYVIGPDDELIINVYGYSEKTYRQRVNAEGNIFIENVGPILVSGLSIEEAETKIRGRFGETIYKAMKSGGTKLQLRLGNIRSMRITIIGEAKKPGTYTVSSLTTLFNALYLCGGPSDQGSYRNIELIRGNKVLRIIDLYKFLTSGDRQDNLLLQEQDIIRIPYYDARVVFSGEVKRPGVYEVKSGEYFDKLFAYAGNYTDSAYRKAVTIYQVDDSYRKIKDLLAVDFMSYQPKFGDSIVVRSMENLYANRVQITGAVHRPGTYELEPGMDLHVLIEKAGGIRGDAFQTGGSVFRIGKDLGPENVPFNLSKVLKGEQKVTLMRDDEIIISSILDLRDTYTVSIDGEVNKPGSYEWRKDLTLRDVLVIAGGLTESGNTLGIEIARRLRNAEVKDQQFFQSELIRVNVGRQLDRLEAEVKLEPFDMIMVRSMPGYQRQRTVYVSGPVLYPGKYVLENSGERISHLIKRAGGFKSSADTSSIFIRRFDGSEIDQEQRSELISRLTNISLDSLAFDKRLGAEFNKNFSSLNVNLLKALQSPGSNDDLLLEDGDQIIVSRSSSLVKVSGEVYFPTLIPYENDTNLKYYINRTGGYTTRARMNQSFVIYPNGYAEQVKRFLIFKSYPKITPRSEVFVPAKAEKSRAGLSIGEWVAISSIFATLGTLVITLLR